MFGSNNASPASEDRSGSPLQKKVKVTITNNYQKQRDGITTAQLLVEGEKLFVSRELLAAASPVWEAMFSGSFKESQSKLIPLPGKKLQTVLWFLDYLYPETSFEMTDKEATALLPLSEEYQMDVLKKKCIAELRKQANPRLEVVCLAAQFNLTELQKETMVACAKRVNSSKLIEEGNILSSSQLGDALTVILKTKLDNAHSQAQRKSTSVFGAASACNTDPLY